MKSCTQEEDSEEGSHLGKEDRGYIRGEMKEKGSEYIGVLLGYGLTSLRL